MDTSNDTLVNLECTNGREKMHMEKKFYMQELWTLGGSFLEKEGGKYSRKTGNGQEMAALKKPFYLHLKTVPLYDFCACLSSFCLCP